MKFIYTLFLLATLTWFTGCNAIRSSINYKEGRNFLEQGDYSQAISKLEKAVELDPSMGRNHTKLSCAYLKVGNLDGAWLESRQSFSCKYPDYRMGIKHFRDIYRVYVTPRDLDKTGTPISEIEAKLGTPDMVFAGGQQYVYGTCLMTFKAGSLVRVSYFE